MELNVKGIVCEMVRKTHESEGPLKKELTNLSESHNSSVMSSTWKRSQI